MSTLFISPARTRQVIAAIVAFALVSVFVIRTSDAAFTAETTNENNRFSTGEITLAANYEQPMFGGDEARTFALGLKPGDVVEECIEITYSDTLESTALDEVEFGVTVPAIAETLADHLSVESARTDTCTEGEPTYTASSDLADLPTSTGWTPEASPETQAFHFRVTVGPDAPQGRTAAGINLTWSVSTDTDG